MAPPEKTPTSHYYYFVVGVAAVAVAVLLLLTNVFAVGCCSCCGLKRLLQSLGLLSRSSEEDRISRLIPARKYGKSQADDGTCAVCLAAFDEGEHVRQLPACKHAFHVACIDMWLASHASCPLCRSHVLPPPLRCPKAEAYRMSVTGVAAVL